MALCQERVLDGLEVVEYLKTGLDLETLTGLLDALGGDLNSMFRLNDLPSGETPNLGLLMENPKLLQRPILWKGSRAVVGRPPERVLELLT